LGGDAIKGANGDVDAMASLAPTGDTGMAKRRIRECGTVGHRQCQTGVAADVAVFTAQRPHGDVIASGGFDGKICRRNSKGRRGRTMTLRTIARRGRSIRMDGREGWHGCVASTCVAG
jgi:hypothetical protein